MVEGMGIDVFELDLSSPFSAARARNEGFAFLLKQHPEIKFVQFVDGDCTLASDWLRSAGAFLEEKSSYAAVVGHLQELHPDVSVYNRLCAMEWKSPAGDLENYGALGGISMIRASVFKQLNGFNCKVIAGEDSELGVRMALAGFKVRKIDHPMAVHDANMYRFKQWWKRAVRSGHAIGQRAYLNGNTVIRDCVKERNSVWFWGILLPIFILLMFIPTNGLSVLLLAGYLVLAVRLYRYRLKQGDKSSNALLYAFFIVLGKFAEAIGMIKFHMNRVTEQYEIIEYK